VVVLAESCRRVPRGHVFWKWVDVVGGEFPELGRVRPDTIWLCPEDAFVGTALSEVWVEFVPGRGLCQRVEFFLKPGSGIESVIHELVEVNLRPPSEEVAEALEDEYLRALLSRRGDVCRWVREPHPWQARHVARHCPRGG